MFKEKATMTTSKRDDVIVNMVLVVTIRNQIPQNVVFKEKGPLKKKSLVDWHKRGKASMFV
jgi:hypothetical protein